MASTLGSSQSLVSKVTKVIMVVQWGWGGGGLRDPCFLHLCLFKVCFTHSSYLPAFFPLPHLPVGLSIVMHAIVTVVSV